MPNTTPAPKVAPRYKIGYRTDEWGAVDTMPDGIPDPAGDWVRYDDHAAVLASAAPPEREPHPPHRDCGCAECAPSFEPDEPTLTVTMRYDLSPSAIEGAIRDKLIEMGWTPPDAAAPKAAPAPAAVAGRLNELEELDLLNKLIHLGARAASAHAKSNSDDGHAGTAAYVEWSELRADMGALIRKAYAAPAPAAQGGALDAARYRWLRSCNLAKHPAVRNGFELGDAHLDAAIDAAIAAKEGGQP